MHIATASQPNVAQGLCTPRIRLFTELVCLEGSGSKAAQELEAAVLSLHFDYRDVRFSCPAEETQARYLLESFGAVEIDCLDGYEVAPGSLADYLVHVGSDAHHLCAFGTYAVPQLKRLGWQVDIDPGYRWQVVSDESWFANLEQDEEQPGWFQLDLGIELDGRRINLLPVLVDMLQDTGSLEALLRHSGRCVAVPVDKQRYLALPPERFRAVMGVLSELYRRGKTNKQGKIRPHVAAWFDRITQSGESFPWQRLAMFQRQSKDEYRAISAGQWPNVESPKQLQATLRPYQHAGLRWLQHLRQHGYGGILADDMGLGKTLQTIAHIVTEKAAGRSRNPTLVLAPTSLVGNWKRELRKFAPHLSIVIVHGSHRAKEWCYVPYADVVISTYPLVVRDIQQFCECEFYLIILDEAQWIKNPASQTHKAVCALRAQYRLCLSGTPVENSLRELWSQFAFLMPGMLGDYQQFRYTYETRLDSTVEEESSQRLRELVHPFVLRRTKDRVARDLPAKTEIVRTVELSGGQRDLYEAIRLAAHANVRTAIAKRGVGSSTIAILDALTKLRQVCCDPRLVSMAAARRVEESAKYELLMELLRQQLAQERRVLVFSQFTSMLALIGSGLQEQSIAYLSLTGSTRNRQQCVDEFEAGRADVFLISLKAGGTGLNLTSADTVVHYDPWWNPAAHAQATDRAYRIGQTKPVFVYSLIVAGSVEEKILHLQQRKHALAQSIFAAQSGVFQAKDVDDLFEPLG